MKRHIAILLLLISVIGVAHASSYEYFIGFKPMFIATETEFKAENSEALGWHTYVGEGEGAWKPGVGPGFMLRALFTIRKPVYRINISGSVGAAKIADFLIKMASIETSYHIPQEDEEITAGPQIGIDWHAVEVTGSNPAELEIKPCNPGFHIGLLIQRYFEKARVEFTLDYQYMYYDYEMNENWFSYSNKKINMSGVRFTVATSFRLFGH